MAQSQLALYNLALVYAGADYTIEATTEESVPAETLELIYENTRQMTFRAAHWNSCKKYVRLVEEKERNLSADWVTSDPAPGWAYSYEMPDDVLAARYLTDFAQFEVGYDDDDYILSTNGGSDTASETPVLCYTFDQTDVTKWEPDLYNAMAHALAGYYVLGSTGKRNKTNESFGLANLAIMNARANNANEQQQLRQQVAERLQARGYEFNVINPYVHPYGPIFTGTGAPVT